MTVPPGGRDDDRVYERRLRGTAETGTRSDEPGDSAGDATEQVRRAAQLEDKSYRHVQRQERKAAEARDRAAEAHDRAAQLHDRQADLGWGDVEEHREQAHEHREEAGQAPCNAAGRACGVPAVRSPRRDPQPRTRRRGAARPRSAIGVSVRWSGLLGGRRPRRQQRERVPGRTARHRAVDRDGKCHLQQPSTP